MLPKFTRCFATPGMFTVHNIQRRQFYKSQVVWTWNKLECLSIKVNKVWTRICKAYIKSKINVESMWKQLVWMAISQRSFVTNSLCEYWMLCIHSSWYQCQNWWSLKRSQHRECVLPFFPFSGAMYSVPGGDAEKLFPGAKCCPR